MNKHSSPLEQSKQGPAFSGKSPLSFPLVMASAALFFAVLAVAIAGGAYFKAPMSLISTPSPILSDSGMALANHTAAREPLMGGNPNLVADVAERVAPSVVNIDVAKTQRAVYDPFGGGGQGELFRYFFGLEGVMPPGFQGMPPGQQPRQVIQGNGSGVIVSKDGYVLTNNHVVRGADEIKVTLNDGRVFPAKRVGSDRYSDLAVLKIDAPNLVAAKLGSSDKLRPGEWVLAVGSPLGFDHTVTLGIISAISRRVPDINMNMDFIQTDAAINPGNSGGPLVNLNGEVVGINTAISGRAQNIGFAIPVNVAKTVTESLISTGKIARPWIGIAMSPLSPQLALSLGLSETTKGVVVAQVVRGGPAEKAGFREGDVVQRMNGQPVMQPKDIQQAIQQKPINTALNFQVLRDGRLMAIPVNTAALPEAAIPEQEG